MNEVGTYDLRAMLFGGSTMNYLETNVGIALQVLILMALNVQ